MTDQLLNRLLDISILLSNIAIIITITFTIKQAKAVSKQASAALEQTALLKEQMNQDKTVAKSEQERQIKSDTLEFSNKIISETDKLDAQIRAVFGKEPIDPEDSRYKGEVEEQITQYLRLMERLSVGINTGVYDLDVYARMFCNRTISVWGRLIKVIEKTRQVRSYRPYDEFESVVKKLEAWKTASGGKRGNFHPID